MLKKLLIITLCVYYAKADGYFSHDVGQLHLSGGKWDIQHVLNLTEYIETSAILKDCIDSLNDVCTRKKFTLHILSTCNGKHKYGGPGGHFEIKLTI